MNIKFLKTEYNTNNTRSRSKRLSTTFVLCLLLLTQFSAEAQAKALHTDPVVGTWNVIANIYNCETDKPIALGSQALALFNADGTRHETNATSPALRTPAYGHWRRVKKQEYEFAFKFYRFDANGVNIGSTSVRHDLFLAADNASYYSEGIAEFLDPADNLLFVVCSDATATRYE